MTVDNLSYYNCCADYFGFISSNTWTYHDSGAGFRMVGCRRLQMVQFYTGLFITPSGISELDCATTETDTAERSISIGRESLQVFFFLY